MIVSVMQPYFFPYLGYYQLVAGTDVFVFLNDVNFIKKGWINRNRILLGGQEFLFTIPLVGASQNRVINEIDVAVQSPDLSKLKKTIEVAYKKAPYFEAVYPEVCNILDSHTKIAEMARASVTWVFDYVGVKKDFRNSEAFPRGDLFGQDRILSICCSLHADLYLNPPGGRDLYASAAFEAKDIVLKFLMPRLRPYDQGRSEFMPGLSILDLAMRLSPDELSEHIFGGERIVPSIKHSREVFA